MLLLAAAAAVWGLLQPTTDAFGPPSETEDRGAILRVESGRAGPTDAAPSAIKPIARTEFTPRSPADSTAGSGAIVFTARFLSDGQPIVRGDVGVEFFRDEEAKAATASAASAADPPVETVVEASGVVRTVVRTPVDRVVPAGAHVRTAVGSDVAVTDASGRAEFASPFSAGPLDGGRAVFQVFGRDGGLLGAIEIALPAWLPPEGCDLGIVEVTDANRLFAGRVVDDAGDPIVAAAVEIGRPPERVGRNSGLDFVPLTGLCATAGKGGAFAVRGDASAVAGTPTILARVSAKGYLTSAPVAVLPGASELRFVLVRPSVLAMSFVHQGEPLDGLVVHVALRPTSGVGRGWTGTADASGAIEFGDLPSGSVKVEIFVADRTTSVGASARHEPAAVVGPIELSAGEVCRDRRLNPFDLGAVVRRILLRVETEDGRPVPGAVAAIVEQDPSSFGSMLQGARALFRERRQSFSATAGKDGVVRLYAPPGLRDVAVAAWDFVPTIVRGVAAEDVVRLKKVRTFGVVLSGGEPVSAREDADAVFVETDCPADPDDGRSAVRLWSNGPPSSGEFFAAGAGAIRYRVLRGRARFAQGTPVPWKDGVIKADAEGRLTLTIDPD